jgi:hypothetical protein
MSYTSSKPAMIGLFTTVACAAEENAAVKWAKDLTTKYDASPSGQKSSGFRKTLEPMQKMPLPSLKWRRLF